MSAVLRAILSFLGVLVCPHLSLQLEILALRHQLAVYQRATRRPMLQPPDRILWSWLSQSWPGWREALVIVKPRTVIAWQRRRFRDHWRRLSRDGSPHGRPRVSAEIRALIQRMSNANPTWGAPRIVGELAMIGIEVAPSTVAKYMVRRSGPASPTWRSFLRNHLADTVAIDFFVVPTARNQVLFVFLAIEHARRRIVHLNVTSNPTAAWTAQQLREAFPWEAPRFLLCDRNAIYGGDARRTAASLGIEELVIGARKPWQNPYVERLIGSIRRECLDHVIVIDERHLLRVLRSYATYYHERRTHLSLEMDCPVPRVPHAVERGSVVEFPHLGGLHHHYERAA